LPTPRVFDSPVTGLPSEYCHNISADDYTPEFIYPDVEVKTEDLQDVKQELADDYNTEDPCFTTQV